MQGLQHQAGLLPHQAADAREEMPGPTLGQRVEAGPRERVKPRGGVVPEPRIDLFDGEVEYALPARAAPARPLVEAAVQNAHQPACLVRIGQFDLEALAADEAYVVVALAADLGGVGWRHRTDLVG